MKRHFGLIISLIAIFNILLLTSCDNNVSSGEDDKIIIGVSIVPEATFVEAVCGDLVEIVTTIPPGSSPANYEPTPKSIEKLKKCDLYFSIGVPTEKSNIMPLLEDVEVVSLQDEVSKVYPDRTFESGGRDPHIWLSPKRVNVMVNVIADKMCEIDEANKDTYKENAQEYIDELDAIDEEISTALKDVNSRKFIVYHPAFGYLANDYDLEMYALEQDGKEATPKHLQEMIDFAKQENIKVIFYQKEIDSSQSEAFANEIGGKTIQLDPLSEDYINNLKKMAELMAELMAEVM